MPADGVLIVKRYQKKKAERSNFDSRWERMAPYLAPSRVGITGARSPGTKQTTGVYDSTTMLAAEMMAHFIAGHIINPGQRWQRYEMEDPDANKVDEVREWTEECSDRYLKRVGASMFYAEAPEALIDYAGFGTGFLLCEEAPQPVNRVIKGFRGFYFHSEKTGRFIIDEGPDGLVDTAFREYELSAGNIKKRWPDDPLPENISNSLKGEQDKLFKIVHAIYPRPYAERGGGSKGMPWVSCWVELDSKTVIHESGYRKFPVAAPRYHKTPGEVYGRGRGDIAFPDTWTLNSAKRMGLEDLAMKIRPPVMVRSDSVIGTLRLVPGGPTVVNTRGAPIRDVIMPFETGSRPEISNIKEEELRRSIREIFYVDTIRMLLETSKSEMTAYEFARKIELLFRLLGTVYGRLEWELLYQTSDIGFDLMYHAGEFPPPPPAVMMTNGTINTVFQNPIAKAQRAGDAESILLAANDLAPLGQLFPQVFDRFDPDKTSEGVFEIRGVPARWSRSDKEIAVLRAERQKQNEQDLQLERAKTAAEAAGKVAPAIQAITQPRAAPGL